MTSRDGKIDPDGPPSLQALHKTIEVAKPA